MVSRFGKDAFSLPAEAGAAAAGCAGGGLGAVEAYRTVVMDGSVAGIDLVHGFAVRATVYVRCETVRG